MSYDTLWIVELLAMVGLPQALGIAVSRLSPDVATRRWLWPVVSALTFSCGWILWWRFQASPPVEAGQYRCGQWVVVAAFGLFICAPANFIIAGILQALLSFRNRRKAR